MRYLLGLVFGLLLGAAAGAAIVYFNPLILDTARLSPDAVAPLNYSLGDERLLVSTEEGLPRVPIVPAGAPRLWERGIRRTWLQSFVITDGDGAPAAVASKLVMPSPDSNAFEAGLITDDAWLITFPGRGSIVAAGQSNVWPLLRDSALTVDLLNRPWTGPKAYGMLDGGTARVAGVSGDLAGRTGILTEILVLDDYPRTGFGGLVGHLDVSFDPPAQPQPR